MGNYFGVLKVNLGGGLALFWKKEVDVDVDVETSSLNHIDALINRGKEDGWRFMGFYGDPARQRRMELWNLLRTLHAGTDLPKKKKKKVV